MKREFDENGYDQSGFDRNNIHRDTGTRFNSRGYDFEGYDENGRNLFGLDRDGFDADGYDYDGYGRDGFNREGIHKVTHRDYNWEGFRQDGTNVITGTPYNSDGYDVNGYDQNGISRDGISSVTVNTFDGPRTVALKTPRQIHKMSDAELDDYQKQVRSVVKDTDLFAADANLDHAYDVMGQVSAESLYRQNRLPEGYMATFGRSLKDDRYASAPYDDGRPRDNEGYDWDGFDKYGNHRDTGDRYSPEGFDADGFDKDGYDWEGYNADGFDRYGNHRDGDGTDPLAGNEPLWSSDNGFSGNGEPSGLIATKDEKGGWHKAVQGGKKALSNLFGSAKSAAETAKTGDIEVSGYTYIRNGKEVHVDGYTRKRSK